MKQLSLIKRIFLTEILFTVFYIGLASTEAVLEKPSDNSTSPNTTSTNPAQSSKNEPNSVTSSRGFIIGMIILGVFVVAVIIVSIAIYVRKRNQKGKSRLKPSSNLNNDETKSGNY